MPLFDLRLKVESPLLGNKRTPPTPPSKEPIRRFVRHKQTDIAIDLAQWTWALDEAAKALHLAGCDLTAVRFPSGFRSPSLVLHERRWHHQKREMKELFESIQKGAQISMDVLIASVGEDEDKAPPTSDEFVRMMEFVGDMIGLSPWGSRFSYGRFSVIHCVEK